MHGPALRAAMMSPLRPLLRLTRAVQDWPVASQQQSRRNAMVALTACAHRRAEREDVDRFLEERATGPVAEPPATRQRPAVHG